MLGITTVAIFTMHGAIFLIMKTEGALHNKLRSWVTKSILFFRFYLRYAHDHDSRYAAAYARSHA